MNGHELRNIFEDFNSKYFGGKLPQYRIRVKRLHPAGRILPNRRLIEVGTYESQIQKETLLHEMVHAAAGLGHGKRFLAEMQRLRQIGAPFGEAELNGIRMGVRRRLTADGFRNDAKEFLADNLQGTFASFVEGLNSTEGHADSVAEFVRKYTWARGAFRAAVRNCEEERARMASFLARRKAASPIQR